jgi:hypothetical protein
MHSGCTNHISGTVVLAFRFSRHVTMPYLKMADNACSYSVGKINSSTLNRTDYTVGKSESHEFAMHDVPRYQIIVQNFSTRVTTKYSRLFVLNPLCVMLCIYNEH